MGKYAGYLHTQLCESIKAGIIEGKYALGSRLPPERELSELYGVSRATVRQALRTLAQQGYICSRQGSGTYVCMPDGVSTKGKLLGVIMPTLRWSLYSDLAQQIAGEALRAGGSALLAVHDDDLHTFAQALTQMKAQGAGMLLVVLPRNMTAADIDRLENIGIPYMLLVRDHPALARDKVVIDNVAVGAMATKLLLKKGCKTPVYVGPLDYLTAWDRLRGYRQALVDAGVPYRPDLVVDASRGSDMHEQAVQAVQRMLSDGVFFDGVMAFNDVFAAYITELLRKHGKQVPGDVAVVGVDNHPAALSCSVHITTIAFDGFAAGNTVARIALRRIAGEEGKPVVEFVPTAVISRASCPVPSATEEPAPPSEVSV